MSITRRCCNRFRNAAARTTEKGTCARAPALREQSTSHQQRRWNRSNPVQHPSAARTAAPGTDAPSLHHAPLVLIYANPPPRTLGGQMTTPPISWRTPRPLELIRPNRTHKLLFPSNPRTTPRHPSTLCTQFYHNRAAPSPSNFVVGLSPHRVPLQEVGAVA